MAVLRASFTHVGLRRYGTAAFNLALPKIQMRGCLRGAFLERQHRRERHVYSACSRGRGSTSLTEMRCVRVSACASCSALTREQFLARLHLRMDLDANDDLPTRPSGIMLGYPEAVGLSGAVQSAE
jgi:hypothetical protein